MSHIRSAERFSSRIDNYIRYRPGYPKTILERLKDECGLTNKSIIADLGSGTGKLAEIFLENGNAVLGVEPNGGMRAAAEVVLARFEAFQNIDGTAELTTLEDSSVDFVVAGQAFHWFNPVETKRECIRILKPSGWAVLIWNERQVDSTPFLRAYEELLLTYGTDYQEVRHENARAAVETFFSPRVPNVMNFPNRQEFDFEALKGRLLSSSYTPEAGDARFEPMLCRLTEIFTEYQHDNLVAFEYDTRAFYGQLT